MQCNRTTTAACAAAKLSFLGGQNIKHAGIIAKLVVESATATDSQGEDTRKPVAIAQKTPETQKAERKAVAKDCMRMFWPNACVSDRRQRETVSRTEPSVEAASCSLDAMVRLCSQLSTNQSIR
jgi:hypothetical protein